VNAAAPGGEVAHGFKFLGGGHGGQDRGDLAEPALLPSVVYRSSSCVRALEEPYTPHQRSD
jgi:hypothetical protein